MLNRYSESHHKRRKRLNYYSPSYSSISTFSFSHGPTVFNSRRNTDCNSHFTGTVKMPRNDVVSSKNTENSCESERGLLDDIRDVLSNSSKLIFKWVRSSKDNNNAQSAAASKDSHPNVHEKRPGTGSLLVPNKRKHLSLSNEELFLHSTPQKAVFGDGTAELNEKLEKAFTPAKESDITFSSKKDPFNWDKVQEEQANPSGHFQYGSKFFRRRNIERQTAKGASNSSYYEPNDEISYLRMVFNGEYRAPKMIEEEKDRQIKLLEEDRIRKSDKSKNPITQLTERIKAVLIENKNVPTNDDLIIVREQKAKSPAKYQRNNFNEQKLKFDTSLLTFEEEFKSYRRLLEERKKVQEAVRQKQQKKLLPELSVEDLEAFKKTLNRSDNNVLFNSNNIELKVHDFKTLGPKRWLNDTVIEFFMKYIESHTPKTAAFNSYFYTTLSERGYQGVRRWMKRKKVRIQDLDMVFVPINLNQSHWALGVIDIGEMKILYVDSLSSGANSMSFAIMKDLQNYLMEESQGKLGENFELCHLDCPQQPNGFDCGIYVCMNALYLSRKAGLEFDYNSVRKMRPYIGNLILSGK
ncbi:LAFE_0B06700g1_1 [Lachancea fermentati]|uniref:LAFE_0B06700g1_1 n=1 Tax=Lachancea fermentati TaxID=4955 RepID=A0A1G4M800_LACFM|nr:LAFE_0B06700g1_1 [Lachancea fermentati]